MLEFYFLFLLVKAKESRVLARLGVRTDVVFHLSVMFVHQLQEAHFYLGLVEESLLVLNDLNGDPFLLYSVVGFYNLRGKFLPNLYTGQK